MIGSIIVGIFCVLLIMAGIRYKKQNPKQEVIVSGNRLITNEQVARNLQTLETLDTDDDGLYDWEEALWGTNPNVADTDEDGISDRDEVNEVKKEYNLEENSIPQEELSPLDLISRDLYSTIAILDQQGALEEAEEEISQLFQEAVLSSFSFDIMSLSNLELGPQTESVIEKYRNDLRRIVQKYQILESDITFLSGNIGKAVKQPEALAVLEKYDNYLGEMLELVVPVEWSQYHLDVVNGINGILSSSEAILYSDQDPLVAASAALQLPQLYTYYQVSLASLLE